MRRVLRSVILCAFVIAASVQCSTEQGKPPSPPNLGGGESSASNGSSDAFPKLPIFPKNPVPGTLKVYDAQGDSTAMRYLLVSLQGIVNRTRPRIFLYLEDTEPFWLEEIADTFGVAYETVADPWALLDSFIDEVEGAVVYDPDMIQTANVATMLGALNDALIVHPSLIPQIEDRDIPIIEDLRGRFESNVEMYEWAFGELWPSCNHRIIAFQKASIPNPRDYYMSHRIFTFQLDLHRPDERELLEHILANTPENIPVLGWPIDELLGVMVFSEYGKFLLVTEAMPNLSVYSGLTLDESPGCDDPPEFPEPENTIYVGFAYGDGDNLTYVQRSMLFRWQDVARGSVPLGWEFNAPARDVAPHLVAYYNRTKTPNDVLIGPASGVSYIYPNLYPDLDYFCKITSLYYEWHGFRTIWLINDDLTLPDEIVTTYTKYIDLDGVFIDYWPNGDRGFHFASDGTPVLRSWYVYLLGPEQIPGILADAAVAKEYLYPDSPFFVFIGVNAWITPPSLVKQIVDSLDERYTVVRPDVMFGIMRKAHDMGWIE